ncbi:enoyl-CoA hydratase-related protein [Xanthobacter aminoxidans]|uniref:Enoyl-CoA hydratase-related protein n=1 Tax=Xanthobacter aminoxidans TaxID=186280 RepID=A0ABW6ZNE0_9HYPH|nr:enoyl-CoA hydratase-related protein [Xanthobacter aminoxidans]MCL8383481.1 enoyl-CoA hydratase-related protein [Xanthobacter aminoxidans]
MDLVETLEGGVATLRLNRPEAANALSLAMFDGLIEAIPRLGRDPNVRAIVITGTGRAFCAGGDVKAMQGRTGTLEERYDELQRKHGSILALSQCPKVTIAAINGAAAGAGLVLALACDLRIATQSARFVTSFANVGFAGDFGGSFFLSRLVGPLKAQELYLLSEKIDAQEALRIGLLTRVVPDEAFSDEIARLATRMASGPTAAYRYMKRNFEIARAGTLPEVLAAEAQHQIRLTQTADHAEAVAAFREKRAPVFTGA